MSLDQADVLFVLDQHT